MATSLQRQLAALAAPASSLLQPERKRVSVIFSSEEAAKYDKETFYQIGLDGLNELISICPDLFAPFRESVLFAEGSKQFERAVEDAAINANVDEAIEKFLLTLSPYMMLKAALKCMEWLVYRFHIERFNIESIMECIMPYYDTKHFVSIIQILKFSSPQESGTVDWQWLAPSIQSATVLRKAALYGNVHTPFVLWLFQTFKKLLKVHRYHQDNLSTYMGFMVSTVVGIVTKFSRDFSIHRQYTRVKNKRTIIDMVLNQIYNLFEEIVHEKQYENVRSNREVFSIAYVMIATIGVTAEENPEIGGILGSKIKRIFNLLIKNRNVALLEETYLLINMLVHHIYFEWEFKTRKLFETAIMDLAVVSKKWDVSKVVTRLFIANAANAVLLNPVRIFEYLAEVQLSPENRVEILTKIYSIYQETFQNDKKRKKWAKSLLKKFERKYPSEFEVACQAEPKLAEGLAELKDSRDLTLLVEHPDETVRARAVRKLIIRATRETSPTPEGKSTSKKKKINKKKKMLRPDNNPTANCLLPRFSDESEEVLSSLLKSKLKRLLKIFTAQTLLQGCITVLNNKIGTPTVRLALKKMCLLADKVSLSEKMEKQILTAMIPYLFPRKPPAIITAKKIICSSFARTHPILQKYQSLAEKIHETTPEEFCCLSYDVWTSLDQNQLGHSHSCSAKELTIALLMLKDEAELPGLLKSAAQDGVSSTADYPVTPSDFSKCLIVAEKKGSVSLELLLSAIMKMNVTRVSVQMLVVKFVWSLSDNVKFQGTCLKFLKDFIQKIYPDPARQFWFWLLALHRTASMPQEKNEDSSEFYLIRCLQFFCRFIGSFGIPARVGSSPSTTSPKALSTHEKHKPLTRSQGKVTETDSSQTSDLKKIQKGSSRETGRDIVREGVSPTWCLLEVVFAECLQHFSYRVRAMSMKFLNVIKNVPNLSVDWEDLLGKILHFDKEIVADNSQAASLIGKTIVNADLTSVRSQIIKTIINEETDRGIFMGLVNICQHTGSLIYSELEPMIKKLLNTDSESKQLLALLNCFEATSQSIDIVPRLLEMKETAKVVLKQLSSRLFKSANNEFKKQLYCLMIESVVNCKIPEVKLAIQRCVRKWDVDAALISEELKKCMGAERLASASKNRDADSGVSGWKDRAEVILEFVQGMKKLSDPKKLLPPLFRILKICISLEQQSSVEYLKQLTLTALTMCCQDNGEEDQKVDSGTFHVELVIDCLRCSRNPQTHHHALILLNYAAKRFHEQVLHGVMSLFTFMGNSILRQDDTYSTQLIQQTVTTIIPSLTKAGRGNNPQFSRTVVSSGIFRVFASALQDIPAHRRLPVFSSLVVTLEPAECLWQVLIILVDNALNRDRKKSNLNADIDLAVELAWFCGPEMVIKGLTRAYEFFISMSSLLKSSVTEDQFKHFKTSQSPIEKAVFDFARKDNYQDVQRVIYYTIELIMKISAKFANLESETKLEYDLLLEKCLSFSRIVSGLNEDKIFRLITHKNMEVVEKVNAVLEAEDFVSVIAQALERNEIPIKRKLLDMFNLRLSQKVEWFGELDILLPMLPRLLEISEAEAENEETITLIQTAFVSMKLIGKHLAFSHPDEFIPVFNLALTHSTHENNLLCASALLCLGELFCLKSLLLPKLNSVTSAILRAFKTSSKLLKFGTRLQQSSEETMEESDANTSQILKEGNSSITAAHLLCISTMACMNKMTEQMGPLMGSKFLRKALILILTIDTLQSVGESSNQRKKTFEQRLRVLLKSIAVKIPVRNSLNALKEAFSALVGKPRATQAIMFILKEALQVMAKPDFLLVLQPLCDTFIEEFLSYRYNVAMTKSESDEEEEAVGDDEGSAIEVEDAVVDCLISGAVLKMSEGAFRPYYHRLFEWARGSDIKLITFYRFSAAAAGKLKSLFVTFAGYIMNEAVGCLDRNVALTTGVLSLFYHIFSNDREGFITTDRFNTLVKPLADLMESDYILTGKIELKLLSDTLIQLAVASDDLNRWQHMIDLISTKAHHSDKRVRLNVISILEASAAELGKDFLPLLPPVVPFVAELMNDDESEVEAATQKMLLKLETIIGEPLQPYFT